MQDNSSKVTSSNTTISLQRQLVFHDSLSNATLSLLLFYLRHLVEKTFLLLKTDRSLAKVTSGCFVISDSMRGQKDKLSSALMQTCNTYVAVMFGMEMELI